MNAENRPCGQKKERAVVCDTARSSFLTFLIILIDFLVFVVYTGINTL